MAGRNGQGPARGRNARGGRPAAGKSARPERGRAGAPRGRRDDSGRRQARGRQNVQKPARPQGIPQGALIEGRRAVAEALDAGIKLKSAYVSQLEGDASLQELVSRLEAAGVPIQEVPRQQLERRSSHGAHQGIMVRCAPFAYASVREIVERAGEGSALVVLLDHVTDEGNFGAIVRSAEVAGAAGVIIANARAAQVGVGAMKTSAGAVLHVPIAQVSNLAQAMDELKEAGFWCCGATEHSETDVWDAPLDGRICLVMGSEGSGISRLILSKCDFTCRLPQRGKVESLNVAQAATVMCYEWLRRDMAGEAGGEA